MLTKKCLLILVLVLLTAGSAYAGPVEEFFALGAAYEQTQALDLTQGILQDAVLQTREAALAEQIIGSPTDLDRLVAQATRIETGLLKRLVSRIQFKVSQEGIENLSGSLETLRNSLEQRRSPSSVLRVKKRIANIGGRQVDLLDGEWRSTADGRQFWVSNEYSDIVLTAADYRRYWATSSTVDE